MRKTISFAVILLALAVAGCTNQPAKTTKPITFSQGKIANVAEAVNGNLQAAAATYLLVTPVSDAERSKVAEAEIVTGNLVKQIATVNPSDLPGLLFAVNNAMNNFLVSLPPGKVAPSVIASVTALTVLIESVAPLMQEQPIVPVQPAEPIASVPGQPAAPAVPAVAAPEVKVVK